MSTHAVYLSWKSQSVLKCQQSLAYTSPRYQQLRNNYCIRGIVIVWALQGFSNIDLRPSLGQIAPIKAICMHFVNQDNFILVNTWYSALKYLKANTFENFGFLHVCDVVVYIVNQ